MSVWSVNVESERSARAQGQYRLTVYLHAHAHVYVHVYVHVYANVIPPHRTVQLHSTTPPTAYCRVARTAAAAPVSAPARSHCRQHRSRRAGRRAASPSRPALLAWRRPARSRRAPLRSWRWPRPPRSRVRTPGFTQEGNWRPWGNGECAPIGPRNSAEWAAWVGGRAGGPSGAVHALRDLGNYDHAERPASA